jgi:hypothetical protein
MILIMKIISSFIQVLQTSSFSNVVPTSVVSAKFLEVKHVFDWYVNFSISLDYQVFRSIYVSSALPRSMFLFAHAGCLFPQS